MSWQKQSSDTHKSIKKSIVSNLEDKYGQSIEIIRGTLKSCFNIDYKSPGSVEWEISRIGDGEFSRAMSRYIRRQKNKEYYDIA